MLKSVAVIIPSRNEEKYIERCVLSVLRSNYTEGSISVLVCDGLSTDNTASIVKNISAGDSRVELLINEHQATPFALNIGLKHAKSDVKIILGAHAEIKTDFISNCMKRLNSNVDIACAGGIIINKYEDFRSSIIGMAMSSPFGVGNAHFRTGLKDGYVDTVAFGAYRADVFEKIGYFDEDLIRNQDDEFNYRLIKNKFKIYLDSTIVSEYYVRASFSKLFSQYFQYGYWKVFVNKKHKAVTTLRQLVPPVFVASTITILIGIIFHSFFLYAFSGVWLLYFVAALYFANKSAFSIINIPGICFAFLILHLSYGLGYLEGVINFILLNRKPKLSSKKVTR